MKYRPEIDGLRAIAVLSVIAYHAGLGAVSGGYIGVDVFFVISGFLISSIIMDEVEGEKFSLRDFYFRRARRILPALVLVMAISVPFAWVLLLPNAMIDFLQSVIAVSLFASNILFWRESGYFDTSSELKPLLHTWSLAVEEQFYILFPLSLLLILRFLGKRIAASSVVVACLVSFAFAVVFQPRSPNAAFYLLPSRVWEILIGVCAAFIYRAEIFAAVSSRMRESLSIVGLVSILATSHFYGVNTPFPSAWTLAPTIGCALIILFGTVDTRVGRVLSTPILVRVGLVSYGAYLWHAPAFAFVRYWYSSETSSWVFLGLIPVVFFIAWLSWKFIELPVRRGQRSLFPWVVMSLVLVTLAVFGLSQGGFSQRFPEAYEGDVGQLEFHQYVDETFVNCEPKSVADSALKWEGFLRCKQSRSGPPDVILLGDSHAEHLFIGVAESLPNRNVAFYVQADAPSVQSKAFEPIFSELLSNGRPQTIILTMHYVSRQSPTGGVPKTFGDTVRLLKESGKSVIIVGDLPRFHKDSGLCKYITLLEDLSECSLPQAEADSESRIYEASLLEISRTLGVPYVRIQGPVCSFGKCSMINDGKILFRDNGHLNILGSKLVGRYLVDQINMSGED